MVSFECLVSNVVIAAFVALVAAIVGKFTTRPQITHTLWVLVLVKLVTPAVVQIPVGYHMLALVDTPAVVHAALTSDGNVPSVQRPNDIHDGVRPDSEYKAEFGQSPHHVAANARLPNRVVEESKLSRFFAAPWTELLVGVWITGSLCWFLLAGTRLFRFGKLLRCASPASKEMLTEVNNIASKYGLHNVPSVLVVDAKIPPLIWGFGGRSSMVLPSRLLSRLGTEERARLLAHELAHLKRGDHWIRWFEFAVLGIYWWNPIAWWARSQIQQAEEECCDKWVLWAFPERPQLYAQALVDTVEFLASSPGPNPDIATAFSRGHSLKRRIEMIVSNKGARRLPLRARVVLAVCAMMIVPVSVLGTQTKSKIQNETTVAGREDQGEAAGVTGQVKQPPQAEKPIPNPVSELKVKKADLRYAEKTFAEWQKVLLTDLDQNTQIAALQAIGAFGRQGYASEALLTVKQLVDREIDSPVLSAAVSALGNIGEPSVPLLIDLLQHESTPKHESLQIRVRVVTELGDLGEQAQLAVPALLTFLNETVDKCESIESHARLRESNTLAQALIAIIEALGKIGVDDPQVRKALRELAESSHGIGIQIPAWTALIRLSQKSSGIRDTLVSSLVERGDEAALQAIEATRDGNFVRTVVGKAFDELEVTAENAGWALRLCVALNDHDGLKDYLAKAQEVVRMVGSRPPSHYESRSMMKRFLRLFEYLRKLE